MSAARRKRTGKRRPKFLSFDYRRPRDGTAAWLRKVVADVRAGRHRDDVRLSWRNSRNGPIAGVRADGDEESTLGRVQEQVEEGACRSEFVDLFLARLERDAARLQVSEAPPPQKAPTRGWTLGDYSQTIAAIRRATGVDRKQARRAYKSLVKLIGHRGVRAGEVAGHPRLTKFAAIVKRRKRVRLPRARKDTDVPF